MEEKNCRVNKVHRLAFFSRRFALIWKYEIRSYSGSPCGEEQLFCPYPGGELPQMCCCVNRLFPHSVTDTTIGTHAHTPHTLNKFTDTLWVIVCLFGLSLASQMHKTNISYLLTLHVSVYWSVILLPLLYYKFDIWTSTFSFFYYFSGL